MSKQEEQDANRQHELNNFENLIVEESDDKLEHQLAALEQNAWSVGPNKHLKLKRKVKTKKLNYKTLDKCFNYYYFIISAYLKGHNKTNK